MPDGRKDRLISLGLLALLGAIGLVFIVVYLGRDACMERVGSGGSCPTLADVSGNRYQVGIAGDYVGLQQALAPFARIERTNVPEYFAELTSFRIADIDPLAVLAAPARAIDVEDVGPYRLLFGPKKELAWPALCDYFTTEGKAANGEHCGASV